MSDKATFRGVPFFVSEVELTGGRRAVKHEYPFRDDSFSEDMGRKSRNFPVEGYVIGTDYAAARDALLEALETSGPGELVHPYYGTRRVIITNFKIRETVREKRVARFSIDCDETPVQPVEPTSVPDTAGLVADSSGAARASASAEFQATYKPGPRLESVTGALNAAAAAVGKVSTVATTDAQALAVLNRSVQTLQSNVAELVATPTDLVASVQDLVSSFGAGSQAALFALYAFDPGPAPAGVTPEVVQEQANFTALHVLIKRLVAIQLAALAPGETYDSYETAVAARDSITALLDEQAESAPDDTYPDLLQLRADLVKAVPGNSGDLPHLIQYTPAGPVPSLVLAYQLYGALDLEQDIVTRNNISDPSLIPGAAPLEVLSRGD